MQPFPLAALSLLLCFTAGSCAGSRPSPSASPSRPTAVACTPAAVEQALQLGASGKTVDAARELGALIAACPPDERVLAYAGHYLRLAGDFERALEHAQAAVRLNPAAPAWYHALVALCADGAEDWVLARETAARVAAMDPGQVGADNLRAMKAILNRKARVYEITWTLDPAKGFPSGGRMAVPLPSTGPGQTLVEFRIEGVLEWKQVTEHGNDLLSFVPRPGVPVRLTAKVRTVPFGYRRLIRGRASSSFAVATSLSPEIRSFLASTPRVDPKAPGVAALARSLKRSTPLETVTGILDWVQKNMTYRITGFDTVDEVIARKYGECGALSALIVALCRASGIPAREVWGVIEDLSPDRAFAPAGHLKGHAWVELHLDGVGWVPVERDTVSRVGNLPLHYVRMTHLTPADAGANPPIPPRDQMVHLGGDVPPFQVTWPE